MKKLMKLRGRIQPDPVAGLVFSSTMYDGTAFSMRVDPFDIDPTEPVDAGTGPVDGHLFVVLEAQQDARCYLTLPKASITHGRQVVVRDYQLLPRNSNMSLFRVQRLGGTSRKPDTTS